MIEHKPPKTSYLLGSITGDSSGYCFSLPATADSGYWHNGTFPVRLYAVKVSNETKTSSGEERARVEVKLVAKDRDGNTLLETQSIVSAWSDATEISGAWIFVPNGTRTIEVYAPAPGATSRDSEPLCTIPIKVIGDKVVLDDRGGRAMSREYDHVYYESVMVVDNKVEAERYGRVEWSDGTQTASNPSVMAPMRGLPSTTPVSLEPSDYGKAGEKPKIVRFYSDSGFTNETASFKVFDVGGNEVTIMAEGNDAVSAPYAVTPASGKFTVVNRLTSTVHVWPMGWKQGDSDRTGQPIPWAPSEGTKRDGFDFTVVTPSDHDTDTAVGHVPYRGPGPEGDTTIFTRARALNWQSTGDPKIVIRQDTRGEKGRGH
ncbi:MAG: hypothetical protein AB1Z98_12730 [Nannocystaceae bacterium]